MDKSYEKTWPWNLMVAIARDINHRTIGQLVRKYGQDEAPKRFEENLEGLFEAAKMPKQNLDILCQRFRGGLTYRVIAENLGISDSRVGEITRNTLARLRHPSKRCYLFDGPEAYEAYKAKSAEMVKHAAEEAEKLAATSDKVIYACRNYNRLCNILLRRHISTLRQAFDIGADRLHRTPQFGVKMMSDLTSILAAHEYDTEDFLSR